jgi:hypothetical protein
MVGYAIMRNRTPRRVGAKQYPKDEIADMCMSTGQLSFVVET